MPLFSGQSHSYSALQWHWTASHYGARTLACDSRAGRNVYRGSPLSYAQDEKALRLAVEGIELGMDRELTTAERFFFWLPLGHSEDLALQERSVLHAEEEAANAPSHRRAGAEFEVSQAKATRDVIARLVATRTATRYSGARARWRS